MLGPRRAAAGVSESDRGGSRRERLLASALWGFARSGYHETSVDDIVARARTSKTAFYDHFASKEACLAALLEEQGGALMNAVQAAAQGGRDHRERLRRGIAEFVRRCDQDADLGWVLLVRSVGLSSQIEAQRLSLQSRFASLVAAEQRLSDDGPSDSAAQTFAWAVVGAVGEVSRQLLRSGADAGAAAAVLGQIFAP
ncbi:MAG TPA: TetR/AcrR family transcriptional regulator [Candidatus Nitrosotalea sp.]|nr:TetR/AcrR family transcriptional regulator [Candidatus Nitrosotalea sp.]